MRPGSPASKAYEVFLLFVASNIVHYARIKAGEPGDEARVQTVCYGIYSPTHWDTVQACCTGLLVA